ncbi:MAG TPA: monovalent cation/H+ antiporter complex subunit F [Kiritimatiellia bacterium]|nr:monovalent cation/H+ antiporter complex subunit F [Kiritimatiellia bacterium]HMO99258.1 monovalent cation/H+ antiporter complex subunit F [Kiritimatiellia bacterium]HMP96950.1 monovalent cation/H+ antiporter complex subunit F [Kiritimatiellia bacterium]
MTSWLDRVAQISMVILAVALVLAFYRVLRGPSLPDRIVALDLIASVVVGMLTIHSIRSGDYVYLTAGIALALIAFIGTVALALFIRRGAPQ